VAAITKFHFTDAIEKWSIVI